MMTSFSDLRIELLDTGEAIAIPGEVGLSQSLDPIDGSLDLTRDVNGGLIVIQNPLFRKYRSEISGRNVSAPGLGGLWLGARLRIHSIARLTHTVRADGSTALLRDPVPGSIDARDASGRSLTHSLEGRTVSAPGASHVYYRPVIDGILAALSHDEDEMTGAVSWSLSIEEL